MISLRDAIGKPVIVQDDAESPGRVDGMAIDATSGRVSAVTVGSGRSTAVVDWSNVHSVGPDALIITASREPTADDDRVVSQTLNPIAKRVLSDLGNELGQVDDVVVDDDGTIRRIEVGRTSIDGTRLRGIGSFALVVAADPSER